MLTGKGWIDGANAVARAPAPLRGPLNWILRRGLALCEENKRLRASRPSIKALAEIRRLRALCEANGVDTTKLPAE